MRPVSEQLTLFALMVTMGIILGIIFDFYRAIRGIAEPGKFFTIVGDIIFWVIATVIVFSALMWKTWGEMRAYVFIGLIIGFIVHWYYISPLVLKLFKSFILFVIWMVKIIWRIVSWPFITAKALLIPPILYGIALGRAGKKYVGKQKNKYQSYVKTQNKKCSNFVKAKIKKIFTRPPKNE